MNLQLFKVISEYPFIHESNFYDSDQLRQNSYCIKKCKEKDCFKQFKIESHKNEYECSKNYNTIFLKFDNFKVLLNGILFEKKEISKELRYSKSDWIISKEKLLFFILKLEEIERNLISSENEVTEKNFSMFHDFKTSMNIIFSCTQNIIDNLPGNTFEEKLHSSEDVYKDLYNSLRLITSQLGMLDVIINPGSISFGNQKEINIFKLFDKIRLLFRYHSASKRNISIILTSIGNRKVYDSLCYESIEFIPLILLDNALKYSAKDSVINIKMNQTSSKVKVTVENIGPFVADENKERIFEKFYRDESGRNFAKEGIGMGLWIARQILESHQSYIRYCRDVNETRPVGLNIFEFELQTI